MPRKQPRMISWRSQTGQSQMDTREDFISRSWSKASENFYDIGRASQRADAVAVRVPEP